MYTYVTCVHMKMHTYVHTLNPFIYIYTDNYSTTNNNDDGKTNNATNNNSSCRRI